MRPAGITLIETLLSVLLLSAAILTVTTLFHLALRRGGATQHKVMAARLAESAIDEMRVAGKSPQAYREGLPRFAGVSRTHPDGFVVRTEVGPPRDLVSPCSGLESRFADRRELTGVIRTVSATVSWGNSSGSSLRLVGQLREPRREAAEVVIRRRGSAGAIAPTEIFEFEAELTDTSGRPIPGVTFLWSIRPITGNATVLPPSDRSGHSARFQHRYYYNPVTATWSFVPGTVRVEARARYMGRELSALSSPVELTP